MCSPKTMVKIGIVIAIPLALGYLAIPQLRTGIASIAPFAIFAICPLSMLFMGSMMGDKKGKSCSSCEHNPTEKAKHVEVHAH